MSYRRCSATAGLKLFLDEVERHPLRVYTLVSMVAPQDPLLCNTATFTDAEIAAALGRSASARNGRDRLVAAPHAVR